MHQTDFDNHDWLTAHLIAISAYCDKHNLTQVQDAIKDAVIAALNRQAEDGAPTPKGATIRCVSANPQER